VFSVASMRGPVTSAHFGLLKRPSKPRTLAGRTSRLHKRTYTEVGLAVLGIPTETPAMASPRRVMTPAAAADWGVAAVLIVTLAQYAYVGRFARYLADDYANKISVSVRGYWAQQVAEYLQHGGRFSAGGAIDAVALLSEFFVQLLPGLLLVVWTVAIMAAVRSLVPSISRLASVTVAMGLVFITLHITPNPFLSLYWMTGSLTYTVPLVLGTALVAMIASRRAPSWTTILAAGLLAFVAGGFNETYAGVQLIAIGSALLGALFAVWPVSRRSRTLLMSSCLGTLGALVVLVLSPGNALRFRETTALLLTPRPSLAQLPAVTINFAMQFVKSTFVANWGSLLTVGALLALIGARTDTSIRLNWSRGLLIVFYVAAVAMIAMVVSFAPTAYVESLMQPSYGEITPVFIGICAVAVAGWSLGKYVRTLLVNHIDEGRSSQKWKPRIVAIATVLTSCLVAAIPAKSSITIWGERGAFHAYAATKDAQAALARSAGQAGRPTVTVPPLPANLGLFSHLNNYELSPDPSWWINGDEALYYGVGSIRVRG
jgi:hypothetical protein